MSGNLFSSSLVGVDLGIIYTPLHHAFTLPVKFPTIDVSDYTWRAHARVLPTDPDPLLVFDTVLVDPHRVDLRLTAEEVESIGVDRTVVCSFDQLTPLDLILVRFKLRPVQDVTF